MSDTLRTLHQIYGGDLCGRTLTMPTFGHSLRDRGTSVTDDPRAPDGFLVRVHNGSRSDDLAAKNILLQALGRTPAHLQRDALPPIDAMSIRARRLEANKAAQAQAAEKTRAAMRMWDQAQPAAGSPVAAYLAGRGVELIGDDVRWHPSCPFGGDRVPAMLALVRNIKTGEPQAVHRTALALDGRKADRDGPSRLSFGPLVGGAVQLVRDVEPDALGIGEGVETALSLRALPEFGPLPVWSLIAAAGIAAFPVLRRVQTLWIAVDHDPAGIRAARACAERWRAARREVRMILPDTPKTDLNDLVMGGAYGR